MTTRTGHMTTCASFWLGRARAAGGTSRGIDHPGGLDTPGVAALADRLGQRGGRGGVAEHAVLDAGGERVQHGRRRTEIAVGDPQRDDVASRVALPARAPGAGPLDRRVEVELHADL